ncbi:MAG TPA: AI-2E family transporter [Candidatus Saccharimonadales bacterium]|nr:AI-2E family transporter [Candidatus Saccharimonadales bacterium]
MFKFNGHKENKKVEVTISNKSVIRIILLVLASILFWAALGKATHALTLIFISFFLALALNAPVHWIAERLPGRSRGSRSMATAVSFILVIVIIGAFLASIVPPIIRQTNTFIGAAPGLVASVHDQNSSLGQVVRKYHLESQVDKFSSQLSDRLHDASGTAVSTVSTVGSSIFSTITILVLTFMMLIEGPHWIKLFTELLPPHKRSYAHELGGDMYKVVKGYVNGQVILAVIAALLIAPMLFILGISYPVALIFVVFICGLIPMVGHTIGAIIVTLVALFHSVPAAIAILAYYILYQQIENYVIQPRIQANTTNLSPLLVLVAVLVGVSFGGLLGGLVAIPVMGCLRVFVVDQLQRRHMLPATDLATAKVDTK